MNQTRRETWLFWLFALLILATGLGLRDPWPADEPRFALVAKQMVESGDWLFRIAAANCIRTSRRCSCGCRQRCCG